MINNTILNRDDIIHRNIMDINMAHRSHLEDSGSLELIHDTNSHDSFGVHIAYGDIYSAMVFVAVMYFAGKFSSKTLNIPSFVGEIMVGMVLGPHLLNYVPFTDGFKLLGQIGWILFVLEAGIFFDPTLIKLSGSRGVIIAFMGFFLPFAIGFGVAQIFTSDILVSIAIGSIFAPTSLTVTIHNLSKGNMLNTPVGQLIASAAILQDSLALILLSELNAMRKDLNPLTLITPIICAILFLCFGGFAASYLVPGVIKLTTRFTKGNMDEGKTELTLVMALSIVLMPAFYYSNVYFLAGIYVSGLTCCKSKKLHSLFIDQFKRVLQWLIKFFFAASIGFQVPITLCYQTRVWQQSALLTIPFLGKFAVGFFSPNFYRQPRCTGWHVRDCLITSFSMASEGEFALVIATFVYESNFIPSDLYVSAVLAIIFSSIIPSIILRVIIKFFNIKSEQLIQESAFNEVERIGSNAEKNEEGDKKILDGIRNDSTAFLCIQTKSNSTWDILTKMMQTMWDLRLEVIDHRSWHPRGEDQNLVNEIYAQINMDSESANLKEYMIEIKSAISNAINQPDHAKVKVRRWYPGALEEILEENDSAPFIYDNETNKKQKNKFSVTEVLKHEAAKALKKKMTPRDGKYGRSSVISHKFSFSTVCEDSVQNILDKSRGPPIPLIDDELTDSTSTSSSLSSPASSPSSVESNHSNVTDSIVNSYTNSESKKSAPSTRAKKNDARSLRSKTRSTTSSSLSRNKKRYNMKYASHRARQVPYQVKKSYIGSLLESDDIDTVFTSNDDGISRVSRDHRLRGHVNSVSSKMLEQIKEESCESSTST